VVEGTKGIKGKRVVVNLKSHATDLGELLRFVSKAVEPAATGTLILNTALDLPQGKQPILARLALEGSVARIGSRAGRCRAHGRHAHVAIKVVDFAGVVMLDATVSQTQTGFKSWMLTPFGPLFKKNGAGSRLVITVTGTQDQPKVGLDFGKTIKGK